MGCTIGLKIVDEAPIKICCEEKEPFKVKSDCCIAPAPRWGRIVGDINDQTDLIEMVEAPRDYEELLNKPKIESVELSGNKTFKQLGIETLSVQEIEKILYL